ncbi:hypothetical protein ACFL9U_05795 [Thermodesulfobacteriota bacterium]
MAKPMLITLPFVLLLLDGWPLQRFKKRMESNPKKDIALSNRAVEGRGSDISGLVLEKLPLIAISLLTAYLAYASVQRLGIVIDANTVSTELRISNALVSYAKYIGKTICPQDLAVFYPYPESIPLWQSAAAILLLGSISGIVFYTRRKMPFLSVGWLWYLGTFSRTRNATLL